VAFVDPQLVADDDDVLGQLESGTEGDRGLAVLGAGADVHAPGGDRESRVPVVRADGGLELEREALVRGERRLGLRVVVGREHGRGRDERRRDHDGECGEHVPRAVSVMKV
jgi:hypothetical protein